MRVAVSVTRAATCADAAKAVADEVAERKAAFVRSVAAAGEDRDDLEDLDRLRIELPSGKTAPLGSVAAIESGRGFARIARIGPGH